MFGIHSNLCDRSLADRHITESSSTVSGCCGFWDININKRDTSGYCKTADHWEPFRPHLRPGREGASSVSVFETERLLLGADSRLLKHCIPVQRLFNLDTGGRTHHNVKCRKKPHLHPSVSAVILKSNDSRRSVHKTDCATRAGARGAVSLIACLHETCKCNVSISFSVSQAPLRLHSLKADQPATALQKIVS